MEWFAKLLLLGISMVPGLISHAQQENQAPIVKLNAGASNKAHAGMPMAYSIDVKDHEDGYSAYDEIESREVLLVGTYIDASENVEAIIENAPIRFEVLLNMSKSTCLTCHRSSNKLIGPPYQAVAEKYTQNKIANSVLIQRIRDGSEGHWGEEKMPPHPNLQPEEMDAMVDWILDLRNNPIEFYAGTEGMIKIPEINIKSEGKNTYLLIAMYEDQGNMQEPNTQKVGIDYIKLKVQQ